MDRELYLEVVEPMTGLVHRLTQNIYADYDHSDVSTLAKRAAISTYHFHERRFGKKALPDPGDETLRQMVCDLADTAKHGVLDRNPDRRVHSTCAIEFEVDARGWFRFIGLGLQGRSKRFGVFDIQHVLFGFAAVVCHAAGWTLAVRPADLAAVPFEHVARSYLPPGGLPPVAMQLHTFERDPAGVLAPVDPKEVRLEIVDGAPPRMAAETRVELVKAP